MKQLAHIKLVDINHRLAELKHLQNELTLLLNLCGASQAGCPILQTLDGEPSDEGIQ